MRSHFLLKSASVFLFAASFFNLSVYSQATNILPAPVEQKIGTGSFRLNSATTISVGKSVIDGLGGESVQPVVDYFKGSLESFSGLSIDSKVSSNSNYIENSISLVYDKGIEREGYSLSVTPSNVTVKASETAGFFYALQSLRLSMPVDKRTEIPVMEVSDKPRFEYRGLMLDVSRFFIPKDEMLKIIDCMSMLKLNKLHLHLTDDNGWRLEIKKYPKLTSVGAWRVDRTNVAFPDRRNPEPGEPAPIGGFYTQEDMKEIIKYAQDRQVEIIPEIDMPGHSNAALAAYPDLACPSVDRYIGVVPGMGQGSGSIIFCAGNDDSFTFLEDVIDEVSELFPSRYIHIGGDEAWKDYWKKCPRCAERMKNEGITHIEELQSYFMRRMSKYVQSKGKQVMGWDELTNSTLPEDAIIFGWQGLGNAALKAAAQGHRFVMTPARLLYLIRYQGPQWFEPLTYFGNNTLKDVYGYEPVQENWDKAYEPLLMGVQASMWTEFCNTPSDVTYQVFPRLAALAEVAWSPKGSKNWEGFVKSLDNYLWHLRAKGVSYSEAMFNIQHKSVALGDGKIQIELVCERPDVEIKYTVDGMEPGITSAVYSSPIVIGSADGVSQIRCATYAEGHKMGQTLVLDVDWNLATGKKIISGNPGDRVLVNGIRGSKKQSDFEWTDWYTKDDTSFVLDLGGEYNINNVTLGCLTYYAMGVNKPQSIKVELSKDGKTYRDGTVRTFTAEEIFKEGNFIEDLYMDIIDGDSVRFIKVTSTYSGDCPAGHLKPLQQSRYRFDEIIVR